jgi:hypothetical protein
MPEHPETANARKVLGHARDSSTGFIAAFTAVRAHRNAGRGAPTDEDQDLARAALVFAAAGLDSCVKHLIKDSLARLSSFDEKVKRLLEKFVKELLALESSNRIASALVAESPRDDLIESYIYELTGSSLQSFEQLASASGALGISPDELTQNKDALKRIFKVRNKIVHELDVKFDEQPGQRDRESRTKAQLETDARMLVTIGQAFVDAVDAKLDERG